jgi:hypothetical protein
VAGETDAGLSINSAATDHLPWFVTGPGQTDVLMNIMILFLMFVIFSTGVLYLRLHSLPEHMAHKANRAQLDIVGVLCLLALFTHNHIFWIAALLLAMVELPDFGGALESISQSLKRISGETPPEKASVEAEKAATPGTRTTAEEVV